MISMPLYAQNTVVELENSLSERNKLSVDGTYTTFLSSNTKTPGETDHQSSQDHILTGRLHLPDKYMLSTSFWANQSFQGERKFLVRDSLVTLTRPYGKVTENLSFIPRVALTLPLSENSNKFAGLITGLRFNPILSYNAKEILEGLRIVYRPSVIYNIHKYETAISGDSNYQYSLNQRLTLLYPLLENLYLSLDNTYIRSISYDGTVVDFFSLDQSLSSNITESLGFFIGHNIGGNALAVNGQESDIRIYDREDSQYYIGISYQF